MAQVEVLQVEARLQDFITGKLGQLESRLGQFASRSESTLRRAGDASGFWSKQTNQLSSSLTGMFSRLAPVATGVAAVAAAFQKAREAVDYAGKIADLSAAFGISTDTLQELDYIARMTGGSVNGLAMGMKTLQVSMVNALGGSKDSISAFRQLGVVVRDASGGLRSTETVMRETMSALAGIESNARRTALAQELFGRGSIELLPILGQGKEALDKLRTSTEDLYSKMGPEDIKTLDDFGDSIVAVGIKARNVAGGALAELIRQVQNIGKQKFQMSAGPKDEAQMEVENKKKRDEAQAILDEQNRQKNLKAAEKAKQELDSMVAKYSGQEIAAEQELQSEREKQWEKQKQLGVEKMRLSDAILQKELDNIERESAGREADLLRQQQQQQRKMEMAITYAGLTTELISSALHANKRNAVETRNIRIGEAIMESAMTGIQAARAVWSSAKSWQEGLVATIAVEGLLTGILAAQIAKISNTSFARGTRSAPGGMALVGEFGPEMVALPGGATVYNNSETRNMFDNRNESSTNLNVTINDASGNITERIRMSVRNGSANGLVEDLRARLAATA